MSRLLQLSLLLALSTAALSCSCFRPSFKQLYCGSKTSVRAKIIAKLDNCPGTCDPIDDQVEGQIIYIARVQAVFRGKKIEDNIMYLKTAVNSALCGITLNVGSSYLLNLGKKQRGKGCPKEFWFVGLCDFPFTWSGLTKAGKRFVLNNAKSGQKGCKKVQLPFASARTARA